MPASESATEFPSVGQNGTAGDVNWTDPENVKTDNDSYATALLEKRDSTSFLVARDFGFEILECSVIDGITVEFEAKASNTNRIVNPLLMLTKNGTSPIDGSDNKNDENNRWPTANTIYTRGGAADTWNAGLTPADVNHANFGVLLNRRKFSQHKSRHDGIRGLHQGESRLHQALSESRCLGVEQLDGHATLDATKGHVGRQFV